MPHIRHIGERPPSERRLGVAVSTIGMTGGLIAAASGGRPQLAWIAVLPSIVVLAMVARRRTAMVVAAAAAVLAMAGAAALGADLRATATFALQLPVGAFIGVTVADMLRAKRDADLELEARSLQLRETLDDTERLLRLEEALVACSRAVLGNGGEDEIVAALVGIGHAAGCDLVVIAGTAAGEDGPVSRPVYVAGGGDAVELGLAWSSLPATRDRLSAGAVHTTGDTGSLPEPDRSTYRRMGVAAAAEIPILAGGRWLGHVSLYDTRRPREWKSRHLDLLTTVAEMTAARWVRQEALTDLEEAIVERDRTLAIQKALASASRALLETGGEKAEAQALGFALDAIGGSVAYLRAAAVHPVLGDGLQTTSVQAAAGVPVPAHLAPGEWSAWPPPLAAAGAGSMVAIDDTEGLDPAGAGWYHAHARSVRSELVVPVPDEGFPAVLGVTRTVASPWSEDERRLLATVAQMIGAARTKERARRGLVELVASKDRFIASVSHELRTPMAVVMGLSSELTDRRSQFGETEVAEFIDLIARQSREVAHIIEDLLVAARASAASITVLPEVIRLDREVEAALNSLPSEHTWRLAAVELAPVTTLADPLRIRQIIRNLVSNGHRHGRGGVRVTVHAVEGRAALDVSDDGPPIAPDRQAEMFEAYTASGQSGTPASIGLGLTVSRQLARLMGGDVTYLATPVSTFRLTLPVAEMAAETTIAAPIDALST